MDLIDYIDFGSIYKEVKKNQLKNYPTAQDYIKELKSYDEPYDYVEEMYMIFNYTFEDADLPNSTMGCFEEYYNRRKDFLNIEWSVGGNNATENGDDYWGCGWVFTVDLENELFVGYRYENYS